MKAVKGNKEYSINESQMKGYQDAGFDIYGDDGILAAYGKGKTVPYGDYAALEEKCSALEEKCSVLDKECSTLKEKCSDLEQAGGPAKGRKAGS